MQYNSDQIIITMRENGTARQRPPCIRVKSGGGCVDGLLPAVYEAALVHSDSHPYSPRHHHSHSPDQSTSAIIYVSIVVVFYVVIIAVLVGSTLRRRASPEEEPEETRHLLLYDEKTDKVQQAPASRTCSRLDRLVNV